MLRRGQAEGGDDIPALRPGSHDHEPAVAGVGPRLDVVRLPPVTDFSVVRGVFAVVAASPCSIVVVTLADGETDVLVAGAGDDGVGASLGSPPQAHSATAVATTGTTRRRITCDAFPVGAKSNRGTRQPALAGR
jgi:hypothetical protein